MILYRVVWEIDIETISPEDAAAQALAIQQDPYSTARVFEVYEPDGASETIDLSEETT